MTMAKRETSNIWAMVREDRDVDDLIFRYDMEQDDTVSDR